MRRWMFFVARRFLGTRRSRGAGAGGLAVAGIAVGVATLVVVLAVMNGFQLGTIESLLEINSFHLRIATARTAEQREELEALARKVADRPEVVAAVPTTEIQTLARGFWPEPQGVVFRGVPQDWLRRDAGAAAIMRVVAGEFSLSSPGQVVLGAELARALGLRVGDPVAVTHIPRGSSRPAEVSLTVAGLFRTGYLDFDRNWGFVSLTTAAETLGSMETATLGVKLRNRFRDAKVAEDLRMLVPGGTRIENWRDYNRGIFGALRLEKSLMVFLIALIFLVVSGNIYQLLRRSILERGEEIAILRALGAEAQDLRRVFALEGWLIGIAGSVIGLVLGLGIALHVNGLFAALAWMAQWVGAENVAFSPAYFYIEAIPTRVVFVELALITAGAVGVSALTGALAARGVVQRRPMDLLRSE